MGLPLRVCAVHKNDKVANVVHLLLLPKYAPGACYKCALRTHGWRLIHLVARKGVGSQAL